MSQVALAVHEEQEFRRYALSAEQEREIMELYFLHPDSPRNKPIATDPGDEQPEEKPAKQGH